MITKEEAITILTNHLGSNHTVFSDVREDDDCYLLDTKENRYADDDDVLPDVFGIEKETGKIYDPDQLLQKWRGEI